MTIQSNRVLVVYVPLDDTEPLVSLPKGPRAARLHQRSLNSFLVSTFLPICSPACTFESFPLWQTFLPLQPR
jgi:hypothetical protein